jgi:hypothetical protein
MSMIAGLRSGALINSMARISASARLERRDCTDFAYCIVLEDFSFVLIESVAIWRFRQV